jgi:protein-S-isoprenylcysteine O-methyltransferase Ste14
MNLPLAIQFLLCPVVLISLLWSTAPYGRHYRPGWGPVLPARRAWFLMEMPALLIVPGFVLFSTVPEVPAAWIPASLWAIHYAYRTLLFPALMRSSGRTFPLLLVAFAIAFNLLNGYNNGSALVTAGLQGTAITTPHFLAGTVIFFCGFIIHCHADRTIRSLRRPGEPGYGIPCGGLFRWVTSPHYLGEIIQWAGWAILTWSLAGLAFALFTACNLVPRALSNDRWYRQQFADYPAERKALVPYLF